MATPTPLLLRRPLATLLHSPLRNPQRRWAQVHDVRFLATHPQPASARILEKYKHKLDRKAKEQGLRDVEELKQAYAQKIREVRRKGFADGQQTGGVVQLPYQTPAPPEPQSTTAPVIPKSKDKVKTLSSFLDLEKTAQLPHKEITSLWRLRHISDPQSLCATLSSSTYARLIATARQHPQFILPLPIPEKEGGEAKGGAEIHFLQWTFPSPTTATVLFTHLAEYKLRGEFAVPHTTLTYHDDFAGSKELVLVEGRVQENRGVSVEGGRWLVLCLGKFYGAGVEGNTGGVGRESWERRRRLMQAFSAGEEGFRVEELVEEAERLP